MKFYEAFHLFGFRLVLIINPTSKCFQHLGMDSSSSDVFKLFQVGVLRLILFRCVTPSNVARTCSWLWCLEKFSLGHLLYLQQN